MTGIIIGVAPWSRYAEHTFCACRVEVFCLFSRLNLLRQVLVCGEGGRKLNDRLFDQSCQWGSVRTELGAVCIV